jgi:hypothetical protein
MIKDDNDNSNLKAYSKPKLKVYGDLKIITKKPTGSKDAIFKTSIP